MINMSNGEGNNCKATCEVVPLDSLPALRVSLADDGDVSSPSSRYSSCGESDFECYCSANSIMGTPSMCSTITVFNDFTEYDDSGSENFSLEERDKFNSKYTDVDGKCSQSLPTVGGEYEINGRESNLQIGETTVQDADSKVGIMMAEQAPKYKTFNVNDDGTVEEGNLHMNIEETFDSSDVQHVKYPNSDNSKFKSDILFVGKVDRKSFNPATHTRNINTESFENLEQVVPSSYCGMRKTVDSSSTSADFPLKNPMISKIENFELKESYEDVVRQPQLSIPLRDGGLTASTSDRDVSCLLVQNLMSIDRIEIVGARQKKGNVSFSRRLVGVKEYTVYKIKVWSGKDQWEIERRYHDFLTLYHCLKALFAEQGRDLPSSWSIVEKETKNIFQNASPGFIVQRSVLLQECLQSIPHMRFFSSPPSTLIWFLSPPSVLVSHSSFTRVTNNRDYSGLGKTISLIVEIPPCKSRKQMLEAQHNRCAECHKLFDDEKILILDFVRTFGWGMPRLCEYTSQLFCSSCHTNETAVLPARVLHHWDFTQYPVSQLAKLYLDSIRDQPMLCVTAVNPTLLSKVPALVHIMSVRKKIGTLLPHVLCPFRRSINRGLGTRRYLLESCDFFALRDLIDLSKGAFAALPVMVETVSRKILKHITHQCSICGDVGLPCSARQDCSDPCSLIFPFQEDEIERCTDCQSIFHRPCFRKLASCCCGKNLR